MFKYWIFFALTLSVYPYPAAPNVTTKTLCELAVSFDSWTDCENNVAYCDSEPDLSNSNRTCCQRKGVYCPPQCRSECGFTYKWISRSCVCADETDDATSARPASLDELLPGRRARRLRPTTSQRPSTSTQAASATSLASLPLAYTILNRTHSRLLPDAQCGVRNASETARFRVLGGSAAARGSWRWTVALVNYRDLSSVFCGGTLIGPQWVLTAAHCLLYANGRARKFKLVIAEHDRTVNERSEIYRTADAVFTPPGYAPFSTTHDVALLRLNAPVNRSHFVDFACLPDADFLLSLKHKCYATGWGKTHVFSEYPAHLREVELPLVAWKECQNYYPELTKRQLCAGSVGRKTARDTCTGDSGGGLLCKVQVHRSASKPRTTVRAEPSQETTRLVRTSGAVTFRSQERLAQTANSEQEDTSGVISERWFLYGVTSFGDGCGVKYGVYQRVSAYIDWIKEITAL